MRFTVPLLSVRRSNTCVSVEGRGYIINSSQNKRYFHPSPLTSHQFGSLYCLCECRWEHAQVADKVSLICTWKYVFPYWLEPFCGT